MKNREDKFQGYRIMYKILKFGNFHILILIIILIEFGYVRGEETRRFSFRDVIKIAAGQGLAVLQARNVIEDKENSVRQSNGSFLPSLSAGVSTGKSIAFPGGNSSPVQGSANISMNYSLSASSFANRNAARYNLQSAKASLEQIRDDIMLEAAQKYIAVISAQAAIKVQKADLENQVQQLEQISAFHDYGRKAISDVLQQKTVVSEA